MTTSANPETLTTADRQLLARGRAWEKFWGAGRSTVPGDEFDAGWDAAMEWMKEQAKQTVEISANCSLCGGSHIIGNEHCPVMSNIARQWIKPNDND